MLLANICLLLRPLRVQRTYRSQINKLRKLSKKFNTTPIAVIIFHTMIPATNLFSIQQLLEPFLRESFLLLQNNSNNNTNGTGGDGQVPEWFGWISVVVCIIAWGTFGLPLKVKWVQQANMDPMIFQFYFSTVVFVTSFIVLIWSGEWYFSWWGVLGAAIWVPISLLSLIAIKKLGLGVAQGFWSGINILTSFLWGVTFFESKVGNIGLTVFGLAIMVVGILGLATCSKWNTEMPAVASTHQEQIVNQDEDQNGNESDEKEEQEGVLDNGEPQENYNAIMDGESKQEETQEETEPVMNVKPRNKVLALLAKSSDYLIGLGAATLVGIGGGSMFVPSQVETHKGIVYVVGFGCGTMMVTSAMMIVYLIVYYIRFKSLVAFHPKVAGK